MRALRSLFLFCVAISISSFTAIASEEDPCYYDHQPPVAVCDYHTVVSLGSDGTAKVYATTFDDGSYDNCGIHEFLAARMTPGWCPPGVADDTHFRPYVEFCCEDIGAPIWVILRVVDYKGNYSECMSEVTVQDNSDPWIICPPDITVSCDYWFDWNDLYDPHSRTFGTVVTHPQDRQPIIINDPGNPWLYQPHNWGLDGLATVGGACGSGGYPDISLHVYDYTQCGIGWIHRVWKIHTGGYGGYGGYGGGYIECVQKIHIKDFDPFKKHDIWWPKDYEVDGCDLVNTDPEHLPKGFDKPTFKDDNCSLIGVAYEDQVFQFVEDVCTKILRKWTVIDWCQYDPHSYYPHGIWEHTQVIKLLSKEKPQFGICQDTIVAGLANNCAGRVILDPQVFDDCTPKEFLKFEYKIDIGKNGYYDIIRKGKHVLDEVLPVGLHKVLWIVDDGCGNYNTCSFHLQVIDGKKPTPVCYGSLSTVVMPVGGMVTIWAKDFNVSSYDNCTPPKKLKYSFSSNVQEKSRTFTCDDIGMNTVQVWVTDKSGNQDYCTTFIRVDDNANTCMSMNPLIGEVSSMSGAPAPNVSFGLYMEMPDGSLVPDMSTESDEQGAFLLGFGTTQYDRVIEGYHDGAFLEAISTQDLIDLQEHMFGDSVFSLPAQYVAADVDASGHVGIQDMVSLRNVLLGAGDTKIEEYYSLPWFVIPAGCVTSEEVNMDCDMQVHVDHLDPPDHSIPFYALKIGDINGDAFSLSTRSAGQYTVLVDAMTEGGETILTCYAGEDALLEGLQLSMRTAFGFYTKDIILSGGVLDIDAKSFRNLPDQQLFNVIYTPENAMHIRRGDVLFTMSLPGVTAEMAQNGLDWENGALSNELYARGQSAQSVTFRWKTLRTAEASSGVSFTPNPFLDDLTMTLSSGKAGEARVLFYNTQGQLICARTYQIPGGTFQVDVAAEPFSTPGVYFYHVEIGDQFFKGKIMKVE